MLMINLSANDANCNFIHFIDSAMWRKAKRLMDVNCGKFIRFNCFMSLLYD